MKIASSSLAMQSTHVAITHTEVSESLSAWARQRPASSNSRPVQDESGGITGSRGSVIHISAAAAKLAAAVTPTEGTVQTDEVPLDPRVQLLIAIVERLTGVRIKFANLHLPGAATGQAAPSQPASAQPASARPSIASPAAGMSYEYHAVREEFERTNFSAAGTVTTADGRVIALSAQVSMSRDFTERVDRTLNTGAPRKDPLVLNFGAGTARLTDQRMSFDLDADGKKENVAVLAEGSAYLALDINGNGRIDSGAELFGPNSGSGFSDLAKYDEDGNGWIDENDSVFARLRLWSPSADGEGTLSSLRDHDVGAVFLGEQSTPFELRGSGNRNLGAVKSSGVFLTESGQVNTLQEVDLTV